TVLKQKEATGNIIDTYARLIEEYKTNRFDAKLWSGLNEKIRDPLVKTQATEFPAAEGSLTTFNLSLKDAMPAQAIPAHQQALIKLNALIARLREIRTTMGETYEIKALILKIDQLKQEEMLSFKRIEDIQNEYLRDLVYIRLKNPPTSV